MGRVRGAFLLTALAASDAWASSYRGAEWGLLFVFTTLPFALAIVILSVVLAVFRLFRYGAVFWPFAVACGLGGLAGLVFAVRAPGGVMSSILVLVEVAVVLAAALFLPWRQYRRPRAEAESIGVR